MHPSLADSERPSCRQRRAACDDASHAVSTSLNAGRTVPLLRDLSTPPSPLVSLTRACHFRYSNAPSLSEPGPVVINRKCTAVHPRAYMTQCSTSEGIESQSNGIHMRIRQNPHDMMKPLHAHNPSVTLRRLNQPSQARGLPNQNSPSPEVSDQPQPKQPSTMNPPVPSHRNFDSGPALFTSTSKIVPALYLAPKINYQTAPTSNYHHLRAPIVHRNFTEASFTQRDDLIPSHQRPSPHLTHSFRNDINYTTAEVNTAPQTSARSLQLNHNLVKTDVDPTITFDRQRPLNTSAVGPSTTNHRRAGHSPFVTSPAVVVNLLMMSEEELPPLITHRSRRGIKRASLSLNPTTQQAELLKTTSTSKVLISDQQQESNTCLSASKMCFKDAVSTRCYTRPPNHHTLSLPHLTLNPSTSASDQTQAGHHDDGVSTVPSSLDSWRFNNEYLYPILHTLNTTTKKTMTLHETSTTCEPTAGHDKLTPRRLEDPTLQSKLPLPESSAESKHDWTVNLNPIHQSIIRMILVPVTKPVEPDVRSSKKIRMMKLRQPASALCDLISNTNVTNTNSNHLSTHLKPRIVDLVYQSFTSFLFNSFINQENERKNEKTTKNDTNHTTNNAVTATTEAAPPSRLSTATPSALNKHRYAPSLQDEMQSTHFAHCTADEWQQVELSSIWTSPSSIDMHSTSSSSYDDAVVHALPLDSLEFPFLSDSDVSFIFPARDKGGASRDAVTFEGPPHPAHLTGQVIEDERTFHAHAQIFNHSKCSFLYPVRPYLGRQDENQVSVSRRVATRRRIPHAVMSMQLDWVNTLSCRVLRP